jgi:mono/diheme cytochrome c family protein
VTRRVARGAAAGLAAAAIVLCAGALGRGQGMTSVKAGVYSASQAERGAVLYKKYCASCHAPSRFTDDQLFLTPYAGKPLWEMFDVISDSMPEDNPGGMKPGEYADIIAVLLRMNGFPAGQVDLPPSKEVLSSIRFEKP